MKYLSVLLILPAFMFAANVLVWEYDIYDRFYESDIGDSVSTIYWVEQTLSSLGHTVTTTTILPTNLDTYDVVFALLGWFRC